MIKAENITLSYNKNENILSNINLHIKEGDLVFITGMSGSGKSTLLKSFYGAILPKDGVLKVNNHEIQRRAGSSTINSLRRGIGIVFQDYKLIREWTIEKNIALPMIIAGFSKDAIQKQVNKLLTHVKLTHRKDRFPEELSGGEQQRAGVARALAHNPNIILADEPTGNLDDYSTGLVMELFLKVNALGKTVIIVTHRMPTDINVKFRHFHLEGGNINEYL
ncbi:MAG: cell division transport system ATP-binding protein [Campylobacterota bacterium]|nr:cell division transport system ATP-binding protein [Campylobacterota bacterium]